MKHNVDEPTVAMCVYNAVVIRSSCKKCTKEEHNNALPLLSFTKICRSFCSSGIVFLPEKCVSGPNCVEHLMALTNVLCV